MSHDPMAHYTRQLEEAEASRHRPELDLIREAEARNVFYIEAGHAQFERCWRRRRAEESQ